MRYFRFDYSFCISVEILLACFIAIFTALGQSSIVSALFAISFIVAYAYTAKQINRTSNNALLILLIVACVINVTINGFVDSGIFSFNYYKKVIMFLAFMLLLHFSAEEENVVSKNTIRITEIVPVLAGGFLIYSYYYLGNTATSANGITLGFSNPNFTGMWLLHFFLYDCLFILKVFYGGSKWRLIAIPLLPITWLMIEATRARSCMVGVLFFVLLIVLGLRKKRANKGLIMGITLFPIVYSIIYFQVVYSDWFNKMFLFVVSEGKNLTSRVAIWKAGFDAIAKHPITGSYSLISSGTGVSQMHNTHIDILTSYGILPFILFLRLLAVYMNKINDVNTSFYQYASFCAFCAVIIMGTFEAAIVSGAMGLNLLTVGFVVLAQYTGRNDICFE